MLRYSALSRTAQSLRSIASAHLKRNHQCDSYRYATRHATVVLWASRHAATALRAKFLLKATTVPLCGAEIRRQHRAVITRAQRSSQNQPELETLAAVKRKVSELTTRLEDAEQVVDLPALKAKLADLENDASADVLWTDATLAAGLLTRLNAVREEVQCMVELRKQLEDVVFVVELLESEEVGQEEEREMVRDAAKGLGQVEGALERWELRRLLRGKYDERGARLTVQAGAGGVDAMDWAEMLERMYVRWGNTQGYQVRVVERSVGEEAGIKSVELEVQGRYAYGYLKGEKGTHRLVRASPFNAKGLRQTSFAGVEVMPILDDMQINLEIPDRDLEISFMRSGGKGGQNVNKVETGVRIVHTPTGLAVKCTEQRSQELNRKDALERLKARLLVVLEEQQAAQVAEIRGELVKAEWGQQIRNYVMHPYKLVKDTRTGEETADVQAVMDGELDSFMEAYLKLQGRKETQQELGNFVAAT